MEENIVLDYNDRKGVFTLLVDGKTEGKMTFVFAGPSKIIIDHTEVNPGNSGKSYGKKLVASGVSFAREKNIKIIPLCPFAKKVFDKTPEYQDIL